MKTRNNLSKSTTKIGLCSLLFCFFFFCLLFLFGPITPNANGADIKQVTASQTSLAEANDKYLRYSYAAAFERYEALLQAGKVPAATKSLVEYRMVCCLHKMQRWDRAISAGTAFVQSHRGSIWEARGTAEMARIYQDVDHRGWRVGTHIYRGINTPKTDSATPTERVFLGSLDEHNRFDALEATTVLYGHLPASTAPEFKERIRADYAMLEKLLTLGYRLGRDSPDISPEPSDALTSLQNWPPPNDPSWTIDATTPYDPAWPLPKKILYLFRNIQHNAAQPGALDRLRQASTILDEANWLSRYHGIMIRRFTKVEKNKTTLLPYPYQDLKPETLLNRVERDFADTPFAPKAALMAAFRKAQTEGMRQSKDALQSLIARYPRSPEAQQAILQIREILHPEISAPQANATRPGQHATLLLNVRNTRQIRLEAYKIDLPAILGIPIPFHKTKPEADELEPDDLTRRMLDTREAKRLLASGNVRRLTSWTHMIADKGADKGADKSDFNTHTEKITLPWTQAGNYLVIASIPGIKERCALLVPYNDLMLVRKHGAGGSLLYVANATTGRPIEGAHILTRHGWWGEQKVGVTVDRATTNQEGLVTIPIEHRANYQSNFQQILAWKGDACTLISGQMWKQYQEDNNTPEVKVYGTTDRAVYRPEQQVYFRELLVRSTSNLVPNKNRDGNSKSAARYMPVSNRAVRIVVQGPQGNMVYKTRVTCDAFGVVSGNFRLPTDAPLGEYHIGVSLPGRHTPNEQPEPADANILQTGDPFRVEEYKKPEYQVTVTAGTDRVKLGQPIQMKVHAEYYFGGPVPNASATYKVYRNDYSPTYRFPRPYDYLYRNNDSGDDEPPYNRGEVIAQGKTRLDTHGDAIIRFESSQNKNLRSEPESPDRSFTVEVDVQDASRRVITGRGSVRATKHDVAIFLDYPHGYATQGDRVDVEVKTLNPSNVPISVNGDTRVYIQSEEPDGKETLVYESPLKTDAQGYAQIRWQNQRAGYYRVEFSARDSEGATVKTDQYIWVDGAALRSQRFLFQGIHLAVKNPYYSEGDTAHLLLVTPEPDCTVLLTREADGRIRDRRLVRVSGRSLEIPVTISGADVPNIFLSAVMVRHGEAFEASQELFVPPARQNLQVHITPDKSRYRPGEKAHWLLEVRDYAGRPVHTSLCLAVNDSALSYIQKDYASDIRAYLYGNRRGQNVQMESSFRTAFWQTQDERADRYSILSGSFNSGRTISYDQDIEVMRYRRSPGGSLLRSARKSAVAIDYSAMPSGGMAENGKLAQAKTPQLKPAVSIPSEVPSTRQEPLFNAGEETLASATIRKDFKDTAFWTPSVVTDATGHAHVEFSWPDNLTEWRAHAIGSSLDAKVGMGEAKVTTKKDLLVQLEAPRFVVERDIVTLSAVVHNDTPKDARVLVRLFLDNADITADDTAVVRLTSNQTSNQTERQPERQPERQAEKQSDRLRVRVSETWVNIPHGGQRRVDWLVRPRHEGQMHVRMAAQSATEGDAAQIILPVLVHGVERTTAQSGQISPVRGTPQSTALTVHLPELRKPGSSQLLVTLNPSLAGVLLDALPYLADYPYGCVEQTMSRFLPSVLVAHSLNTSGYDLSALQKAIERERKNAPLANGQAQPDSSYTYPGGLTPGQKAAFPAGPPPSRFDTANPLLTAGTLDKMVKAGLQRLAEFEHADGGWGWWKEGDSDPYMTAYVLDGLLQCQRCGIEIPNGVIRSRYLLAHYKQESDLHLLVYEAYVLSQIPEVRGSIQTRIEKRLWPDREKLSPYGKALLALTLHEMGQKQQARVVLENLETTIQVDNQHRTAHWEISGNGWQWYNSKVETNATILRAYIKINGPWHPGNIARGSSSPYPSMLSKWLIDSRQGSIWQDTRDTAIAVDALAEWMRASQETAPNYTVTLDLGGRVRRTYRVTPQNALFFDNTFVVPDAMLTTGDQTLTLTLTGTGVCYYTAQTRTFSQEEPIRASGDQIRVRRRYFRLTPQPIKEPTERGSANRVERVNPFLTGRYELLNQLNEQSEKDEEPMQPDVKYDREEIQEGIPVHSGDLIEVELLLEASNDYDYVLVEDMKPAGCEPVELTSGGEYSPGLYANREMRDTKVAYFLDKLPQGTRLLTYRLHAEVPGLFHTLPTNVSAMYAPTIRALSNEARISIQDEDTVR